MTNFAQLGARVRPLVRANVDPAVMESLGQLRQQMLQQAALDDAARMDEFFGRVPPRDPNAAINAALEDPLSDMIGATGAPRRMLEAGEFRRAVDDGMTPTPPLVDALLANDRSLGLIRNRVGRLTPEQQQGSLAAVWLQAQQDAADAARSRRAADLGRSQDMQAAAAILASQAAGGAALGLALSGDESDAIDQALGAREIELGPMDAGPGPESEATAFPEMDLGDIDDDLIQTAQGLFEEDTEVPLTPGTPDEAMSWSPGPESPVIDTEDPDLTRPQQRTLNALVTAGIPYGRSMDILLGRASLSPEEYRMVTGGRR